MRIGIVGCGAIHGTHAEAIKRIEGAELAGFYDVVPEKAKEAAEKFGGVAFPSMKAMLAAVDGATVCVPSGLHAAVGAKIARAGRHVLVEKPIEVSVPAGERLIRAAREAGVRLAVVSQHRFAPDVSLLREAVQSGELGTMIAGDAYVKWFRTQAYYDSGAWRGTWKLDGGGCLMNQGVHTVDLISWVMGGVLAVRAQTRTAAHTGIEVEDIANVLVEYRNGAVGVIQASTAYYPGMAERLEVHGTRGSVVIESDKVKVWELAATTEDGSLYGKGVGAQPTPKVTTDGTEKKGAASDPQSLWIEQHRLQIEDWVTAVREDRDPFITGEQALEPLKVILAVYRSARRGGARVLV